VLAAVIFPVITLGLTLAAAVAISRMDVGSGSAALLVVAIARFLHPDVRQGLAAVEAKRRQDRFVPAIGGSRFVADSWLAMPQNGVLGRNRQYS
jgi:uncharacterized membrane protein